MKNKLISVLLAVLIVLSNFFVVPVFADDTPLRDPFVTFRAGEFDEISKEGYKVDGGKALYDAWGNTAVYKNLNFTKAPISVSVATGISKATTETVQLRLDSPDGLLLGIITPPNSGGYNIFVENAIRIKEEVTGVHDLYLVFSPKFGAHVREIKFTASSDAMIRMPVAKKGDLFTDITDEDEYRIAEILTSLELTKVQSDKIYGGDNDFTIEEAFRAACNMAGLEYDFWEISGLSDAEFFEIFGYDVGYNFHRMVETDPLTLKDMSGLILGVLGWLDVVEVKGSDVISVAQNLKLLNGLENLDPSSRISKRDASKLIYNALTAKVLEVESYSQNRMTYKEVDDIGVLALRKDIYKSSGIVTKNYLTSTISAESELQLKEVEINGVKFNAGKSGVAYALGLDIDFYYKYDKDNQTMTVLYYEIAEDQETIISHDDLQEITSDQVKYYKGKSVRTVSFEPNVNVIYNGVYASAYPSVKALVGDINSFKGTITIIDNDDDKKCDLIKIESFKSYVMNSFSDEKGLLSHEYGDALNLKYNDLTGTTASEFVYSAYDSEGDIVGPTTYPTGTVVDVAKSINTTGPIYTKVIFNEEVVYGKVTALRSDENKVAIDGIEYAISTEFKNAASSSSLNVQNINVGNEGEYLLNSFGQIVAVKNYNKKLVAIINGFGLTNDVFNKKVKVRLYTSNGEMLTTYFADTATVDGNVYTDVNALNTHLTNISGARGSVAAYRLNSKKEVTMLDTKATGNNALSRYKSDYDMMNLIKMETTGDKFYGGLVTMSGDLGWNGDLIFNTPDTLSADFDRPEKYSISKTLPNNKVILYHAYSTVGDAILSDVIVTFGGSAGSTSHRLLVKNIAHVLTEDGDITAEVQGYLFGYSTSTNEVTLRFDSLNYPRNLSDILEVGDIINVSYDRNGYIVNCLGTEGLAMGVEPSNLMYKADGSKVDGTDENPVYMKDTAKLDTGNTSIDVCKLASIDKFVGKFMFFKQRLNTDAPNTATGNDLLAAIESPKVLVVDCDRNQIYESDIADIVSGTTALINTYYNQAKTIIIYNHQ